MFFCLYICVPHQRASTQQEHNYVSFVSLMLQLFVSLSYTHTSVLSSRQHLAIVQAHSRSCHIGRF
jgi:hypothetical protein